jgi:ABC-2 type transport system permease protein
MIPIIRWTLWQRRWYIFWWAFGAAFYMALIVATYPSFRNEAATLNNTFNQLPTTVKSLVSDSGNFFSPEGYLSSNAYYIMMPIIFGVLSIGLGSSLIARDEQDHTLELILSRPVSRGAVIAGRALAGVCIVAAVTIVAAGVTIACAIPANLHLKLAQLAVATGVSALLALVFGALAFMFTAFGKSARKASVGIAALLLIASYLLTSLSGTVHWLRWPAEVLPYHYYHPAEILTGNSNWPAAAGMLAAVLLLGILSYIGFRRRDIS